MYKRQILAGLVPHSMVPVILERLEIPAGLKANSVTKAQRRALEELLKGFTVSVTGPRPVAEADVYKRQLLDRHLIEECGRLQVPGRPRLYRTTKAFLRAFHLNSLDDLPEIPGLEADGQLRCV